MSIHGTIRNKGEKIINGLEVSVSVVDKQNKVIKEKKTMVVPNQSPTLPPNETIPVLFRWTVSVKKTTAPTSAGKFRRFASNNFVI
jgi:hypothetical protein